jgi:hypothetical protein
MKLEAVSYFYLPIKVFCSSLIIELGTLMILLELKVHPKERYCCPKHFVLSKLFKHTNTSLFPNKDTEIWNLNAECLFNTNKENISGLVKGHLSRTCTYNFFGPGLTNRRTC